MNLERPVIAQIVPPLDESAMDLARTRQDSLTKPPGSLGRLETLSIKLAGICRDPRPRIDEKVVILMAGDHGVVAEGVSAFPQEITAQMVLNFLNEGAAVNVLADHVGARVVVVDMGVAAELEPSPNLVSKKVAHGTHNLARRAAMTREQALQALKSGGEIVEAEVERGMDLLALGEMGIGNTTPSTAIASALTRCSPSELAGRGTGVDGEGLARKIQAVERGLSVNQPDPDDAVDVLAKVGGFEIGGLAGAILAAAAHSRPVLVDGFIATAAAMVSVALEPNVQPYLIAAHLSEERGHKIMLDWLELDPLLDLDMRLGEGTGAVLGCSLVEAACRLLDEMATFNEAGLSDGNRGT